MQIKIEYTLEDVIDAVQYGFDYCKESQNDGVSVPVGNTLQWLMAKKDLLEVPDEFNEIKNKVINLVKTHFDNEERKRYYGLRVGDIVSPKTPNNKEWHKGVSRVIEYGFMDNNSVVIQSLEDGTKIEWVADQCAIIKKVEDIKKA